VAGIPADEVPQEALIFGRFIVSPLTVAEGRRPVIVLLIENFFIDWVHTFALILCIRLRSNNNQAFRATGFGRKFD
jgi:hypothetical protein